MNKARSGLGIVVTLTFLIISVYIILFYYPGPENRTKTPDLLFFNGKIITVDNTNPHVEAVLVSGGRITVVGTHDEALAKASPLTKKINLKGKTLIPGFNDNHTHTFFAGTYYESLVLWGKSCTEITKIIEQEAAKKKPGTVIRGQTWDYDTCPAPHKSMLDRAAPHNPVYLIQYSGHAAWVNSRTLGKMGIDNKTPDPAGGQIVRDKNGEPTGILRDTAMDTTGYRSYILDLFSATRHREIIDRTLALYRKAGITTAQDNTWEPLTVRLLQEFRQEGILTCRFTCWPRGDSFLELLFGLLAPFHEGDTFIRKGPAKYFTDGAFSTRTGWLSKPYADEPGNHGSPRYSKKDIDEIVMEAARERRQIAIHAIGDMAVHQTLNAIEQAQKRYSWTRKLRFRLEHVQLVMESDIPRMKRLGVVACVQPFALCNPEKDITLLGKKMAAQAYPYYSMFKAGVPLSFGSDIPAEVDYRPLLAIYYAVTRKNKTGTRGPLNPKERFTPAEALSCYTMGSAYAEFMEDKKGSITVGKYADLVVLSGDLTTVPRQQIKDLEVLMTVVDGKIVFEKAPFRGGLSLKSTTETLRHRRFVYIKK